MRHSNKLLIAFFCVALISASGFAFAASTAWFGVSLPPGLSDPHRPVVDVAKIKVPPATVPAGESNYHELDGKRIYQDVKAIVDFSRHDHQAGNKAWGRITGLPAAKATVEWHAAQFKKAGLRDVQVQEYEAAPNTPMWVATKWEAVVLADPAFGAGSRDVVLQSAVPASGSIIANGELTAELVDVGAT